MITIKFGGSVINDLHPSAIKDIQKLATTEKIVIVHGGGKEVTSVATQLGKEQKFIVSPSGIRSRFTDKDTIEIYTMVMSGRVNKQIVKWLVKSGLKAVGISGIDSGLIRATRKSKLTVINDKGRKMVIDGGYTGKIKSVDSSLLNLLMGEGYLPVVSPIALSEDYEYLNVDGDRAAAYVAGSLQADKIIFITDVSGLIQDDVLVRKLTLNEAKLMLPNIGFGMEKKVLACTEALMMGTREAIISSGRIPNPISSAIGHNEGTVITN